MIMITKKVYELPLNRFVYYYLKILGLCPFDFSDENMLVRCNFTTIYTYTLCVIYTITFFFMTKYRSTVVFSCETPMFVIANAASIILEYLTVMSIWLNGIFLLNTLCGIIKGFKHISDSLRSFGVQEESHLMIRKTNNLVLLVHSTYTILMISNMIIKPSTGTVNRLTRGIFNGIRGVTHIIIVFFICALGLLKQHLCFVHEGIKEFPGKFRNLAGATVPDGRNQSYGNEVMCLRALAKIYTDLQILLKMIERYFRAPILFFLLTHFIDIASYFYVICFHLEKGSNANITPIFLLLIIWLVFYIVEVLTTIDAVSSVILQGQRTGNILHGMIAQYYPTDVVDIAKVISLRIFQEPMKFSLYGFIDLSPSLLHSVFCAMATYFVIMMQLDIQNKVHDSPC